MALNNLALSLFGAVGGPASASAVQLGALPDGRQPFIPDVCLGDAVRQNCCEMLCYVLSAGTEPCSSPGRQAGIDVAGFVRLSVGELR